MAALGLPAAPDDVLAEHSRALDSALREVGGRLIANPDVRVDGSRRVHLTGVKAIEEPQSLMHLRARTTAMLPRVELPDVILEVMSGCRNWRLRSLPPRAGGPGWRTCRSRSQPA